MCFQDRAAITRTQRTCPLLSFIYSQFRSGAKHLTAGTSETGPYCAPCVCSGSPRSLGPTAPV